MTPEHQVVARFHMGISYTRTSDYETAREFFDNNLELVGASQQSPLAEFFTYQGLGFFSFFFSRHTESQSWAEKGYASLLKQRHPEPLLQSLSLDLQGHNLIQIGEIHKGQKALRQALDIATANKLKDLEEEISLSLTLYQGEYSQNLTEQMEILTDRFRTTDSTNDYSRSQLMLQVVRLMLLKGQFKRAQQFLTENHALIYQNENKRKLANMNSLLAQLMLHRGQPLEALSLIKVARSHLKKDTDISLLIPVVGLEARILESLGEDVTVYEEELRTLTNSIDSFVRRRVQKRYEGVKESALPGQDPVGDLLDELKSHKSLETLQKIVDMEMFGVIPRYFDVPPGEKCLVVPELKNMLFAMDSDEVIVLEGTLTKTLLSVLQELSMGPIGKQALIEKVWGYEYDPLRHDSLVYTAMVRLRKILGGKAEWIQTDESVYFLSPEVRIINKKSRNVNETSKASGNRENLFVGRDLNHRQLQALDAIKDFTSVSDYSTSWGVTTMTSLRDLRGLCELGYFQKVGRGRATKYMRVTS